MNTQSFTPPANLPGGSQIRLEQAQTAVSKARASFIIFTTLIVATLAQPGAYASQILDTFNRSDANTLGPNWTAQYGNAQIVGGKAEGVAALQQSDLLTFDGYATNSLSVDVMDNGGSLEYVALVLGYADLGDNYFVKVQDQGGNGMFNYLAFYYGNNGDGLFHLLDTPFSAGAMTATLVGTTVTLDIAPGVGGMQTYSFDYGRSSGGSGVGLGFYGAALADNFSAASSAPEPGSLALLGLGSAFLVAGSLLRRRL